MMIRMCHTMTAIIMSRPVFCTLPIPAKMRAPVREPMPNASNKIPSPPASSPRDSLAKIETRLV